MAAPIHNFVEAWAELGGELPESTTTVVDPDAPALAVPVTGTNYAITAFKVNYGFNRIPTATVRFAVGARAGALAGSAVASATDLDGRPIINIYLRATSAGTKRVFSGYVNNVTSNRVGSPTGSRVELVAQCVHWLDDMKAGITYSEDRSPPSNSSGSEQPQAFDVADDADPAGVFNAQRIVALPALHKHIANSLAIGGAAPGSSGGIDFYATILRTFLGLLRVTNGNTLAIEALGRFVGQLAFTSSNFFTRDESKHKIATEIVNAVIATQGDGTIWDALRSLAANFRFGIVPTVEKAFVIPAHRSLAPASITTELSGNEYTQLRSNSGHRPKVKGVYLFGGAYIPMNSLDKGVGKPKKCSFIAGETGTLVRVRTPVWLTDAIDSVANLTYKLNKGLMGRGKVANVAAGFAGAVAVANEGQPDRQNIGSKWCEAIYNDYKFGGGSAVLQTPVDYDIIPGMCIGIESAAVDAGSTTGGMVYGFVADVAIVVDGNNHSCSRQLTLTHLRSGGGVTDHPLFIDTIPTEATLTPGTLEFA